MKEIKKKGIGNRYSGIGNGKSGMGLGSRNSGGLTGLKEYHPLCPYTAH
jgi:hypothetical protein